MNEKTLPIQFSTIENKDSRLFGEIYSQNRSDNSFEEKLKFEQARLGLLFSPFSQLESLFSPQNLNLNAEKIEKDLNSYLTSEQSKPTASEQQSQFHASSIIHQPSSIRVFDSLPLQSFNKNLQQLLSQTGWLVPNIIAQPAFYQASLEGILNLNFDLQALVDEIIKQAEIVKEKGRVELSLRLQPKELGEIILTLTSHSGVISIQIGASLETKKLLDSQRAELERALKKAKINFSDIKIQEVKNHA